MTTEETRKQEAVVEAVLFTMGKSVETAQLAAALECTEAEAEAVAERLRIRCVEEKRGVQILRLENSWQMGSGKEFYEALIRVAKAPKKQVLSQVVLETLSIVAYRQPVTKTEISKIRGVSSDHAVNRLIEYGLVYEAGRLDAPGRPALFATTEEFLRRFGVDSKLDLPETTPDQEAEIAEEVRKEIKYRFGTEEGKLSAEDETEGAGTAESGEAEEKESSAEPEKLAAEYKEVSVVSEKAEASEKVPAEVEDIAAAEEGMGHGNQN